MSQKDKAMRFRSLHRKGAPLVLYNIWDAGSAKALADAGATALATGSWSVAAAQGFADGEAIPLDFLLRIVERIVQAVDIPVSVDFEGGYATDPADLAENVRQLIQTGAIGINFEDRVVRGEGLHPIEVQAGRIRAIREAARQADVPLFINARTDLFLNADPTAHEGCLTEALQRETAYAAAGADGFFVPGLTDPGLVRAIVSAARLPVNVMMRGTLDRIAIAAELGAGRASYGPGPYRSAMADLTARYRALT
ncbi:isocitrate lyase/phosphoenolpyruvate mutase family protein [Frigidibacter sp. RF13]|uniref:isocitrate lyase/PEP mutase family protein n=1 Tax=Frigidibacter sp. RF13 TaxID=2997340 RepID=UPI0022719650|nr:isocitrate lyase/phosphoenolpyruvate mutase family protein [Frigidibacter sp. RF13]MCY1128175.1 isocitrate lyase/phosphoenolpyruvate mutase family protein [Frigidibacter sp. RF13]